jgi:hypothetical protein
MAAASASAPKLTSDQEEEIREAFKLFDTDDSGTIDSDGAWLPLLEHISTLSCGSASKITCLLPSGHMRMTTQRDDTQITHL